MLHATQGNNRAKTESLTHCSLLLRIKWNTSLSRNLWITSMCTSQLLCQSRIWKQRLREISSCSDTSKLFVFLELRRRKHSRQLEITRLKLLRRSRFFTISTQSFNFHSFQSFRNNFRLKLGAMRKALYDLNPLRYCRKAPLTPHAEILSRDENHRRQEIHPKNLTSFLTVDNGEIWM